MLTYRYFPQLGGDAQLEWNSSDVVGVVGGWLWLGGFVGEILLTCRVLPAVIADECRDC